MRSLVLDREIREDELPAAYLLHGEDSGLARELLRELRTALSGGGAEEPVLERFDAEPVPWRDILDVARTMPFFFSPWRILAVEVDDADGQDLRAAEAKMLAGYLAAPTARTLLVVTVDGKVKKGAALHKAFAGAPKGTVQIAETKKPTEEVLRSRAESLLAERGKRASAEVIKRLLSTSEREYPRLVNQIEVLANYVGDRTSIEVTDINAVIPSVNDYGNWPLYKPLERGDTAAALTVLGAELEDGAALQLIVGQIGGFLKSILLAKSLLREGTPRREVPQEIGKWPDFMSTVDAFSERSLDRLIEELQAVDQKIKTSDANGRILLEAFLAFYGRMRKRGGSTSPGRG